MAKKSKRRSAQAPVGSGADAKTAKKRSRQGRGTWMIMDRGSSLLAGILAAKVSALSWQVATGKKPPLDGENPEVEAREAVAWAVVGGALVELVRLVVRRRAASYFFRSTGHLPPGMSSVKASALSTSDLAGSTGSTKPASQGKPARSRSGRRRSRRRR